MRFLCRFRLRFLGKNGSSGRNGDGAFHEDATSTKAHCNQTSVNASRDNESRTAKTASLGNGASHRSIAESSGSINHRVQQDTIGLSLCPGSQQYELSDVSGSAACQDGAPLEHADSGLEFRHLGLEVSIMVSTQDVTEILRKSVSWHN